MASGAGYVGVTTNPTAQIQTNQVDPKKVSRWPYLSNTNNQINRKDFW